MCIRDRLLGVYDKGKLIYTGKGGTGFNDKQQIEMLKQFKPYIAKSSPFTEIPDVNKPSRFRPNPPNATAVWMKPVLVCEVSYAEMTKDGIMRHPSFEAMRIDKNCLLYTSDAADERSSEDLGGRRTIKKKTQAE